MQFTCRKCGAVFRTKQALGGHCAQGCLLNCAPTSDEAAPALLNVTQSPDVTQARITTARRIVTQELQALNNDLVVEQEEDSMKDPETKDGGLDEKKQLVQIEAA